MYQPHVVEISQALSHCVQTLLRMRFRVFSRFPGDIFGCGALWMHALSQRLSLNCIFARESHALIPTSALECAVQVRKCSSAYQLLVQWLASLPSKRSTLVRFTSASGCLCQSLRRKDFYLFNLIRVCAPFSLFQSQASGSVKYLGKILMVLYKYM